MRKFLAIPLLIIYTIAAIGATWQMHYCGGQLVGLSLDKQEHSTDCCGREKEKDTDCCKSISIDLKIDKAQSPNFTSYSFLFHALPAETATVFTDEEPFFESKPLSTPELAQPPPGLWQNIPLFILYSHKKLAC